jgi:SulP family sulfate permease
MTGLARYLPILTWGRTYDRDTLTSDLVAAVIVTIMLIPQSLAYALLAGLPAEYGLYASIMPLLAYAVFGTSRTLAVGPVAVISLMTAAAAGTIAAPGTPEFIEAAVALGFLSGAMLVLMGVLRLGFLANLLSHPVVSAFISASAVLIATSQLKYLFGVDAGGDTMVEMVQGLADTIGSSNLTTVIIGAASLAFLFWVRKGLKPLLLKLGMPPRPADLLAKTGPALAVVVSILAVVQLGLEARGVRTVGTIPSGLPPLIVPSVDPALLSKLLIPAFLISLIGFVESVSVAQTLAAKRRFQSCRSIFRWLSRHRRFCALGRQFRCRCADPGSRRLHRGRHPCRHPLSDAVPCAAAQVGSCRHHHRRRTQPP